VLLLALFSYFSRLNVWLFLVSLGPTVRMDCAVFLNFVTTVLRGLNCGRTVANSGSCLSSFLSLLLIPPVFGFPSSCMMRQLRSWHKRSKRLVNWKTSHFRFLCFARICLSLFLTWELCALQCVLFGFIFPLQSFCFWISNLAFFVQRLINKIKIDEFTWLKK